MTDADTLICASPSWSGRNVRHLNFTRQWSGASSQRLRLCARWNCRDVGDPSGGSKHFATEDCLHQSERDRDHCILSGWSESRHWRNGHLCCQRPGLAYAATEHRICSAGLEWFGSADNVECVECGRQFRRQQLDHLGHGVATGLCRCD